MSSTTTIALATLPPRPTTPPQRPATPGISTNASSLGTGSQQTATPSAAPSPSLSPPNIQTAAPTTTEDGPPPSNLPPWMQKAKRLLTLCGSTLKFTIAVVGVSYTIYIGLAGLDYQRWSARDDSLQSCLALDSHSQYCNATIEAGVEPSPNWKRGAANPSSTTSISTWFSTLSWGPATVAAAFVMTVAAMLVATMYFRPRMEPFHPVISSVRMAMTGITDAQSLRWTECFVADQDLSLAMLDDCDSIVASVAGDSPQHSPICISPVIPDDEGDGAWTEDGCPIGIFYESEPDSVDDSSEGDLAITRSDLYYLKAVSLLQSNPMLKKSMFRVVGLHWDLEIEKPYLQEARIETLLVYLDQQLRLQNEQLSEQRQRILDILGRIKIQLNPDECDIDENGWLRSSLMKLVLEELSNRVTYGKAMLSGPGLRWAVHPAHFESCAAPFMYARGKPPPSRLREDASVLRKALDDAMSLPLLLPRSPAAIARYPAVIEADGMSAPLLLSRSPAAIKAEPPAAIEAKPIIPFIGKVAWPWTKRDRLSEPQEEF